MIVKKNYVKFICLLDSFLNVKKLMSKQTILEAILGLVLRHLQATAGRDLRQEKETIHHIAVAMKTLITNSEPLAK